MHKKEECGWNPSLNTQSLGDSLPGVERGDSRVFCERLGLPPHFSSCWTIAAWKSCNHCRANACHLRLHLLQLKKCKAAPAGAPEEGLHTLGHFPVKRFGRAPEGSGTLRSRSLSLTSRCTVNSSFLYPMGSCCGTQLPAPALRRRTLCFYFHGVLLTHLEEVQHRTWLLSLLSLIWIASSYCIPTGQSLISPLSSQGTWEKQRLYIVTLYVEDNYYFLLLSVKWEERGIAKYISVVSLVFLTSLNKEVALLNGNVQTCNCFVFWFLVSFSI